MRIDSVREVKASLKDAFRLGASGAAPGSVGVQDPLAAASKFRAEPRANVFALDMPARRMSMPVGSVPPIALGVALTKKRADGFGLAVRLQHRTLENSETIDYIKRATRDEADIRYIGPVIKRNARYWTRQRHRPLAIGTSIAHVGVTAGTLGAFVRKRRGRKDAVFILSNNHVLADENVGVKGDLILQPARADRGLPARSAVGTLDKFIPLHSGGRSNAIDAALAEVTGVSIEPALLHGRPTTLAGTEAEVFEERTVAKIGRTTGYTEGTISAIEVDDIKVEYDIGFCLFQNQIEVSSDRLHFSLGGDSGSLVFTDGGLAVGLLFAGSDQGAPRGYGVTYVNPISDVLDRLSVELIC